MSEAPLDLVFGETELLDLVFGENPPPFAVLSRPESLGPDRLDVLVGEMAAVGSLADLPLPEPGQGVPGQHDLLALVPYRQIAERGFEATDDGAPLLAMRVASQSVVPADAFLRRVRPAELELADGEFDLDDEQYAAGVRRIIDEEIGQGAGANFVFKRTFVGHLRRYSTATALAIYRRLLLLERGAYWTFLVHTGEETFIGATPERHISVNNSVAVMNPISGTYRYPAEGPTLEGVLSFLDDVKETDELYMVVDEELKMMARICPEGGRAQGPFLKEMARLAHTEYLITGNTDVDPRTILRETMFAPTVTGSPLESACRVIARHEPNGRRYYSGVVALFGADQLGGRALDSSILIRTAEIDKTGRLAFGTGATIVRHSCPLGEVAETRGKAAGFLAALTGDTRQSLSAHPEVVAALAKRNSDIGDFWLRQEELLAGAASHPRHGLFAGRSAIMVDAEDNFTSMIALQLRALGLSVDLMRFDETAGFGDRLSSGRYDLVVMGPGPGDPTSQTDPKIAVMRSLMAEARLSELPVLAVCLSHQVLCGHLGLPLVRRASPNQGKQLDIDLFGQQRTVGFYNAYTAQLPQWLPAQAQGLELAADPETGYVHALRGPRLASVQFHPESVLTQDGVGIFADLLSGLLAKAEPVVELSVVRAAEGGLAENPLVR
ncbi:MAG: anthranilate synthase family protein [Segniliparus sp.]|uniref:anthranilate synthase family protein n=1 Tax=Segniliparus sp. TaxID=2804064 RepID=UPI003F407005